MSVVEARIALALEEIKKKPNRDRILKHVMYLVEKLAA